MEPTRATHSPPMPDVTWTASSSSWAGRLVLALLTLALALTVVVSKRRRSDDGSDLRLRQEAIPPHRVPWDDAKRALQHHPPLPTTGVESSTRELPLVDAGKGRESDVVDLQLPPTTGLLLPDRRSSTARRSERLPPSCGLPTVSTNLAAFDFLRDGFPLGSLRINPNDSSDASARPIWKLVAKTTPSAPPLTEALFLRGSPFHSGNAPRIVFSPLAQAWRDTNVSWRECFASWWPPSGAEGKVGPIPLSDGGGDAPKDVPPQVSSVPATFVFAGDSHMRDAFGVFCLGVIRLLRATSSPSAPFAANEADCHAKWVQRRAISTLYAPRRSPQGTPSSSTSWPFMIYSGNTDERSVTRFLSSWRHLRRRGEQPMSPAVFANNNTRRAPLPPPEVYLVVSRGAHPMTHNNTEPSEVISTYVNDIIGLIRQLLVVVDGGGPSAAPLPVKVRVILYAMHKYHVPVGTERAPEMQCSAPARQDLYRAVSYCVAAEINRLFGRRRPGGPTAAMPSLSTPAPEAPTRHIAAAAKTKLREVMANSEATNTPPPFPTASPIDVEATVFDVWTMTDTGHARVNGDGHHYKNHVEQSIGAAMGLHLCALPQDQSGGRKRRRGTSKLTVAPYVTATAAFSTMSPVGPRTVPTAGQLVASTNATFVSTELLGDPRWDPGPWECRCFVPPFRQQERCVRYVATIHKLTKPEWPNPAVPNTTFCVDKVCD